MKKNAFKTDLVKFIKKASCSFTCIKEIENRLKKEGYKKLLETDNWSLDESKYYIIRNDASIIAFELPNEKASSFAIITTHSDTPSLLLKPSGAYTKENYLKYNIMPYGGLLNYGWLDHPLSLAGRVVVKKDDKLKIKIVDFEKTMLIVPSVAIHQNENANTNLDLNVQIDLQPILSISEDKKTWDKMLKKEIKEEIVDYDLFAYNNFNPVFIGKDQELFISPRIDNLTSVYTGLISFLESKSSNIKIFCSFNSEEIGSLTEEGADSSFLLDILKRIASHVDIDISSSLANSFIISSDNIHAVHPNHTEYADDTGSIYLNRGFVISKEECSTTNALSSSIVKEICQKEKIKYQTSTVRNDMTSGSTLSGISLRHVSILSIDVGIPELAMHSSIETCSINDILDLYKMMKVFYMTKIEKNNDIIKII